MYVNWPTLPLMQYSYTHACMTLSIQSVRRIMNGSNSRNSAVVLQMKSATEYLILYVKNFSRRNDPTITCDQHLYSHVSTCVFPLPLPLYFHVHYCFCKVEHVVCESHCSLPAALTLSLASSLPRGGSPAVAAAPVGAAGKARPRRTFGRRIGSFERLPK